MARPAFAPAPPKRKPVVRQVPAVTRAIAILRLLGRSGEPLGVNAIARELDLIPSTCLHILRVLVLEELVAFDPESKHYSLDEGILAIARSVLRRNSFAAVVQRGLNQLSQRYGVAAVGVKVTGLDHFVVVAIAKAEQPLRIHVEIGSRFPALISATGRCLVAFGKYPWPEIESRFRKLRWDRPPSFKTWRAEIEATRRRGYGIDEGNYIDGVTVMAAPVLGRSGVSHAVIVVGVSEQIRRLGIAALGQDLKALAEQVSRQLGRTD
jgi:DNA-binding IclR family transcriptional regulator